MTAVAVLPKTRDQLNAVKQITGKAIYRIVDDYVARCIRDDGMEFLLRNMEKNGR